jgi:hypothetical protein
MIHDGFVRREGDHQRLVIPLFAAWIEAYA